MKAALAYLATYFVFDLEATATVAGETEAKRIRFYGLRFKGFGVGLHIVGSSKPKN